MKAANRQPMNKKYTQAIDKRVGYTMPVVIDWWKRMMMGWVEVEDGNITFFHNRMDSGAAAYTRPVW